jgi:hypothetical protein
MGFITELRQHKFRTWKTLNACFMFACMGVCSSATGPALLDLQLQVNATLEQISTVLPLRSAGSMTGAFVCKFINQTFPSLIVRITRPSRPEFFNSRTVDDDPGRANHTADLFYVHVCHCFSHSILSDSVPFVRDALHQWNVTRNDKQL